MAASSVRERALAKRTREGLEYMKVNGASLEEQDQYIAEMFSDYRSTLKPHGNQKDIARMLTEAANETGEIPAFLKPWRKAHVFIQQGDVEGACSVLRDELQPDQILPHSPIIIKVMLALLNSVNDDAVVEWKTSKP